MSENIDRRGSKKSPIPENLEKVLNKLQMTTLLQLEALGWHLWFVRRPLFQPVMPVLYDPKFSHTAIIEENGRIDTSHGFIFRPD